MFFFVFTGLESIEIGLGIMYNLDDVPRERPQKFLSVVTKCLLLDRVPALNLQLRIWRRRNMNNLIFDIND